MHQIRSRLGLPLGELPRLLAGFEGLLLREGRMGRNGKGKKRKRESRREEVMGRKGERKGEVLRHGCWGMDAPAHTHAAREGNR